MLPTIIRRGIVCKLAALGVPYQDIAKTLSDTFTSDIDFALVRRDMDVIGGAEVMFEITGLTLEERRDKAFNFAMREWFEIKHDISKYVRNSGVDEELAKGLEIALSNYLDIKRFDSIAEGIIALIETMLYPTDPPEYAPYRQLLEAIFVSGGNKRREKKYSSALCYNFYHNIIGDTVELTREFFPRQLATWAWQDFRCNFSMPFDQSIKVAVDKILTTLPTEQERDVIQLRFGLTDGRILTYKEIGVIYNVTRGRIRQIEAKGLRRLRHPERADRLLRIFLESPFEFTRRKLGEMFVSTPPPAPEMTHERGCRPKDTAELLSGPVEELKLSVRAYNFLKNMNIQTVGELVQITEKELLRKGSGLGFGRRSLLELREILESMDLSFGMKIEE